MGKFKDIIDQNYDISPSLEKREESFKEYLKTRKEIDDEFCRLTKLDITDLNFLLFASILQIARWVILGGKLGDKINKDSRSAHDDPEIKKEVKEKQNSYKDQYNKKHDSVKRSEKGYRSSMEIAMTTKVPYDATRNASSFGLDMEGGYHRVHTLGHDPILGYIFGTFNILTDTMTTPNFRSFKVNMKGLIIEEETNIGTIFQNGFESIQEDILRLPAAVFAQALHLKSDENTKNGLPIPFLEIFDPELANKIYKEGYDKLCFYRDLKTVGMQVFFSVIINMVISLVHGVYYDKDKHKSRDLYEIKTRKILMYSNILASSGNILYTTLTKDFSYLDIGGFLVTAYRIIADRSFMKEVEREFIEKKLYEKYSKEIKELDDEIEKCLKDLNRAKYD